MIVTGNESAGDFLKLLGSGAEFGIELTYRVQDGAGGIAHALALAEDFIGDDKFVTILGDNIIEDDISEECEKFAKGEHEARVFLKEVHDPHRFGVAEIEGSRITNITEKPKSPRSNYAVTGIYMYSPSIFSIIKTLKPSGRGELEITDVNNSYIGRNSLGFSFLKGYWTDAGTFDSLFRATQLVKDSKREAK